MQQLGEDAAEAPDVDAVVVAVGAEQEFGRAVPERDDELGEVARRRVAGEAGGAEVRELDAAGVGEQDVGGFEVAVQDPAAVQEGQGRGDLEHERFGLGQEPGRVHGLVQRHEVVLDELHDERDGAGGGGGGRGRDDYFEELHDVGVAAGFLERFDLAEGSDRDTVLGVVGREFFNGDYGTRGELFGTDDLSIRALADCVQGLEIVEVMPARSP